MALAVWMIARGFRPAVVSTTPEFVNATPAGAKGNAASGSLFDGR
jgi:hypothetical protein